MSDKAKKYFCTFADSRMWRSLRRIKAQALAMRAYDDIRIYDESCLDLEFKKMFSKRLVRGSRGFGYWVWKPQIILQLFNEMKDGDLLHYSDVGSWLNQRGRKRLLEYFEMVSNAANGVLAFQVKNTFRDPLLDKFSLPEYKWTKGDLFDYFGVRDNKEISHSEQIGAGNIFFKKCKKSVEFLHEWLGVFEHDFSLADDTPSRSPNFKGFIEHRHDQSIFGILCKIHNVPTLSAFEYWYPSKNDISKPDWEKLADYPVWAKRDKDLGFWRGVTSLAHRGVLKLKKRFTR